ncbi:MAG: hypothetical protein MZU97_05535 [Bacillus subtilis]|nr:hypothetical protein [Bacillus subtilis]
MAWLAVYGYRVLGFTPVKRDLYRSMIYLAIFAAISGYATLRFGGSDELFIFTPPVEFLTFLQDIHELVYLSVFALFIALLMYLMYLPSPYRQNLASNKPTNHFENVEVRHDVFCEINEIDTNKSASRFR